MSRLLEKISQSGFLVTWAVIRAGWDGPMNFQPLLSAAEVNSYAEFRVADVEEDSLSFVADLCTTKDSAEISANLAELVPIVNEYANRVWRVILVADLLKSLSCEPVDALSTLSDFWLKCGCPVDSPHIVQGVNNDIQPCTYYTKEMLATLLREHVQWIKSESAELYGVDDLHNKVD